MRNKTERKKTRITNPLTSFIRLFADGPYNHAILFFQLEQKKKFRQNNPAKLRRSLCECKREKDKRKAREHTPESSSGFTTESKVTGGQDSHN